MNLDAELRAAHARVQDVIDRRYDSIRRWWLDTYNDARRANGYQPLIMLVSAKRVLTAPTRYRCPDCGGPLLCDVEAWEDFTGRPEETAVYCERELDDDETHEHPDWPAWMELTAAVTRWARSNVRVV